MTSFLIEPTSEDTLKVNFQQATTGDRIVSQAAQQLEKLIKTGQLKGGKLLKINGPASVPVSYLLAHKLSHLYGVIAVYDPRLADYVVVISSDPDYRVGATIQNPIPPRPLEDPSFFINLELDLLMVNFNSAVEAQGNQIVVDAQAQIDKLIKSGQLKGKLLKINGKASVLVSYLLASKLAHNYGAIAVFDPKIGDLHLDKYIITISHSIEYQIGETIEVKTYQTSKAKVVVCGPANTGKTCLREGLKQAIKNHPLAPADFYAISGCPDGDGCWHLPTMRNNPELAKQLKLEYKKTFTPEFAHNKAKDIEIIKNSLLLFDVGGKISPENQLIMSKATHAVILAKTEEEVKEWLEFCQKLNLNILAIIYSVKSDADIQDEIYCPLPLMARVKYFHREESLKQLAERPVIKEIAEKLVNLIV